MANNTGKKFGGREAGTPNKTTIEFRNLINQFISKNIDTLQNDFDKLEPKDRLQFFEKMMQYALPRLQAQAIIIDEKPEPKNLPPWFHSVDVR
jgi:hypothetical protein